MVHLGLEINTRLMLMICPASKQTAPLEIIDRDWKVGALMTISVSAVILGHLRTAAAIQPLGAYFFIRIQQWQNTCLALLRACQPPGASPTARSISAWRCRRHFRPFAHSEGRVLRSTAPCQPFHRRPLESPDRPPDPPDSAHDQPHRRLL